MIGPPYGHASYACKEVILIKICYPRYKNASYDPLGSHQLTVTLCANKTSHTLMSSATRKIGNASVHPIGFGAMGLSVAYGAVETDEERFKVRVLIPATSSLLTFSVTTRSLMLSMKVEADIGTPLMRMVIRKS